MKNFVKKNVLPALLKINSESLFHLGAKGKILNVFYHGVVENDSTKISPRHIVKEQFDMHMKYFNKKFNVISLEEAFSLYQQGIRPDKKTITVSFDDGYLNNLDTALPILEKYNIKTTFFISGICPKDDSFILWADIIAFARYFSTSNYIKIDNQTFKKIGRYELINEATNQSANDYIKKMPYLERDKVLNEIINSYQIREKIKELPLEFWKLMNEDQIKKMAYSDLVTIASHGYLHYNLANISEQEAITEMEVSKNILSQITGKEINLISFPDGSYSESVKKNALSLGYKSLLAVDYRCQSDDKDKTILNRWGVSSTTTFETIAFTLNRAFIKHSF